MNLSRAAAALSRASTARPWVTIVVALAVVAASSLSLRRLHVSASLETMLGVASPAAQAFHHVANDYQAADGLLIILESPPGGPPSPAQLIASAEKLCAALTSDPEIHPLVASAHFRPDPAAADFISSVALPAAPYYLGPDATRELLARFSTDRLTAQFARNEALISSPGPAGAALAQAVLRDPLRLMDLVPARLGSALLEPPHETASADWSRDGRAILVRVRPTFPLRDLESVATLYAAAQRLTSETAAAGVTVSIGGPCAIAAVSSRTIRFDAIVSTSVSIILLYILFVIFHRRLLAPVLIGLAAAVGMFAGFGVYAAAWPTISPLAAAVGAILAGLGVDYGTHFVAHFDTLRAAGHSPRDSAIQTAEHMALPIITNCVTSIFGFISLWPSRMPMLSDFARLSTAGLIGCLLCAFTLLPALLVITHARAIPAPPRFGPLADLISRRPRALMLSSTALLAFLIVGALARGAIPRLEGDLTVMHPHPNPALAATDEVIRRFSDQGELIPVLVRAPAPGQLVPAAIDAAAALTRPECRAVGVSSVLGLHMLLPDPRGAEQVRAALEGFNPAAALDAFDHALAASEFEPSKYQDYRHLLTELLSGGAPPAPEALLPYPSLASRVFPNSTAEPPSETVLLIRLDHLLHDRESRAAVVSTLRAALSDQPGATIAGLVAVSEELEAATRQGLPQSILISVALVLGWLVIVFRRPVDVLLALTPLLFAGLGTIAFIVFMGQRLNPINTIAIPLLDGIAVDAGVFLVSAARGVPGRVELVRHLRPTVHAVLLAIATTITGFAALIATHTPAIRSLGLVAAVGIALSAVAALGVLTPILLSRPARR